MYLVCFLLCLRTLFVYTYIVFVCHYKKKIYRSSLEMKQISFFSSSSSFIQDFHGLNESNFSGKVYLIQKKKTTTYFHLVFSWIYCSVCSLSSLIRPPRHGGVRYFSSSLSPRRKLSYHKVGLGV